MAAVKRFARGDAKADVCDLCAAALPEPHEHLLEPAPRQLRCVCQSCAWLFPRSGSARYLRLRTRVRLVPGMRVDDATLRALEIPVRLAFVVPSRVHDSVFATYPNAHGATESVVPAAAWREVVRALPDGFAIEPDVEGLLIDHLGGRTDSYLASVDVCHAVVGLLRRHGAAASGGELARLLVRLAEASR